ncbi:MAG: LCP family protein, partial [Actinomycetota bacterium]|nr:LCP family protein [Actinomycetota bacterium]
MTSTRRRIVTRIRRVVVLGSVLTLTALLVPDAGPSPTRAALVRVQGGDAVDADDDVVWILALGSDARRGQSVLGSRADAIQLVGMNLRTGHATIIGIPRDSYVDIPGHGTNKINSAMVSGGPQLMASAVAAMVGLTPDYVFTTSFWGFRFMVQRMAPLSVYSPFSWSIPAATVQRGENQLDGAEAIAFARMRKALPGGDFDRSRDQGYLLIAGLRRVRELTERGPGQLEWLLVSFLTNTYVDLPPDELYRLARAVLG